MSNMKLTIEQFTSIFCIGYPSESSTEEGELCSDIRDYRDFEYDEIFDSIEVLGHNFRPKFIEAASKLFLADIKDGFASKKKFMCFVLSRCMKLSEVPTLFSFLLVCTFINEIISGIFNFIEVECFTVGKVASRCLVAAFYRRYVDLFEKENGFEGLSSYCEKLNDVITLSDEDSMESESNSKKFKELTSFSKNEIIGLLHSLKEVDENDFVLTDFEKKLLYERDSLSLDIDPSKDVFLQPDDDSEPLDIKDLELSLQNLNIKGEPKLKCFYERCPLCQDNCFKHVVLAAKDLQVGNLQPLNG